MARIEGDEFVMPSADSGGIDSLTQSATELLTKINRIELERLARELCAAASLSLVAINPVMIFGPVLAEAHLKASPMLIRDLMLRKMPMSPCSCTMSFCPSLWVKTRCNMKLVGKR